MSPVPSQRVKTSGKYCRGSRLNLMLASDVRCRLTLLFRWIAPVRNCPAGTTTRPPPEELHDVIALRNASVQSVLLSPTAPDFVISKSLFGNTGGLIRARIAGNCCQGSFTACTLACEPFP